MGEQGVTRRTGRAMADLRMNSIDEQTLDAQAPVARAAGRTP